MDSCLQFILKFKIKTGLPIRPSGVVSKMFKPKSPVAVAANLSSIDTSLVTVLQKAGVSAGYGFSVSEEHAPPHTSLSLSQRIVSCTASA